MQQLTLLPDSKISGRLPTNLTTNRWPIHRWFNFIAGFSPEFVSQCIQEAGLVKGEGMLIDPFAGLSTALVQANFESVCSVGFETHPFFYDISLAKICPPSSTQNIDHIKSICYSVRPFAGELEKVWSPTATVFLRKIVSERSLRYLASAMLAEEAISRPERPLFRLILSRVLELAAHSQTDGIYKAPTTLKDSLEYSIALRKVCDEVRFDVESVGGNLRPLAKLHPESSENMKRLKDGSCSLCVTSPPYLNNFDFAEMTRLQLYFWRYAGSWGEITERVRRRLIVNTTTAPTDLKRRQTEFSASLSESLRSDLKPLIERLKQRRQHKAGKKDYHLLVYPYFAQMRNVFLELRRVLRPRSNFHLIVADSALYGVHMPTHQLLASLMAETGFEVVAVQNMRARGDRWVLKKRQGAGKPLGEFHVYARRN